MEIPKTELFSVLQEFNPWWSGQPLADLPEWERTAGKQISRWLEDRETRRALLLTGPRQVGKTTLYRQAIRRLLASGRPSRHILYATFDHPLLKLAGLKRTLEAWNELYPADPGAPRFLFLDEIQAVPDWQVWIKHQVDFQRGSRIAVTGSASPLREAATESGVGRWETIPLPTLSFSEYLRLRRVGIPDLPAVTSLRSLFAWQPADFSRVAAAARPLTPHFHEYLLRGGFPEPAMVNDLTRCQRLLREDIVDKVLKRDMTALYGVRRILELEKIFLYLCYHDGGILDLPTLSKQLDGINRQSVSNFLDLFEGTHLIYRLRPFGYGKEVLRGKWKVYLADPALPGAMLLLGRRLLERNDRLGAAVEAAFFKHVFTRYYADQPTFSYWRDKSHLDREVDLIVDLGDRLVPFEVKYQDGPPGTSKLKGLRLFMQEKAVAQGYAITRRWEDFGIAPAISARRGSEREPLPAHILSVPAPLACYWLSD
jgi:predicted AAA+ superfamily ATPase